MSEGPGRVHHESVSSLIATPKSSVWQGFLGMAWVLSSSLLLEVVAKLLEGSVGQSHLLNSLAGVLRWVAVAVVAVAALYVLWRKSTDMRESFRIRRELDLTADLVEPPSAIGAVSADQSTGPQPRPVAAPRDPDIAGVLSELPFDNYETAALYDMVTAMLDCADVLPSEHAVPYRDASGVLARLTADHVVVHGGHDRFRVNRAPAASGSHDGGAGHPQDVRRTAQWRAALPALIHHYADLAGRWSVALDSERLGAGAHRWFSGSADRLADLLRGCAEFDHGIELDTTALARIADALDIWYARIGVRGCARTADAMRALAGPAHPEVAALAALRCGDLGELPARRSWRGRRRHGATGLRARRAHEIALRRLEQYRHPDTELTGSDLTDTGLTGTAAPAPADEELQQRRPWSWRRGSRRQDDSEPLSAAVDGFERAWWLLPRRDVTGEVAALIDLAIAHLYQGRLDAARDRLELAETLTRGGRNPSGRAHTFEILGVLWWMRGEPRRALRWWLLALTRYRDLGHELGICRCLQHLGSAVVVVPDYGGLLLDDMPDQDEILAQAWAWLGYAECHRPDHPAEKSLITSVYRARIEQRFDGARGELAETRMRWPVAVAER